MCRAIRLKLGNALSKCGHCPPCTYQGSRNPCGCRSCSSQQSMLRSASCRGHAHCLAGRRRLRSGKQLQQGMSGACMGSQQGMSGACMGMDRKKCLGYRSMPFVAAMSMGLFFLTSSCPTKYQSLFLS